MKFINRINGLIKLSALFVMSSFLPLNAAEKIVSHTPSDSILPMFLGLIAILFVIFFLAFLFKKFTNFSATTGKIKVIESQMIGNKEKLIVVEVGEQQFLLGVTGHSINSLGQLDEANKIGQEEDKKQEGFSHLFSQMLSGKVVHLNQRKPQSDDSKKNDSSVS